MTEMHQVSAVKVALQVALVILLCDEAEGTSIALSPLGMVSLCPGGQALLTCKRMPPGSILYWTVSVPSLDVTLDSLVADQGPVSTTDLQFTGLHSTAFTITRTSVNPLISQMMVNDVTTEMNGSTIYCSENGVENGAPMATVNITNKAHPLNVSLLNHFLTNGVTVTLQWPREAGATYRVNDSPLTEFTDNTMSHNILINLTIPYDNQYNVSIVSSFCGVLTTMELKYVTCDLPTQLLEHPVFIVTGAQDNPHIEGQFITYVCPPRFVLTGPNTSVCTGNGEWEPDPGNVNCIADCGVPDVNINVTLNYSSTLNGSVLTLTCENDTSADEQVLHVTCHNNRSWIPDPTQFTCSTLSFTTVPSGGYTPLVRSETGTALIAVFSSIIITVCAISSVVFLVIGYACGWFGHKRKQSQTSKALTVDSAEKNPRPNEGSAPLPQTPGPLYEELQLNSTPEHEGLVELKENVAYGPIAK